LVWQRRASATQQRRERREERAGEREYLTLPQDRGHGGEHEGCRDHPLDEQADYHHGVVRSGVGQRQQGRKVQAQCAAQAEQATKDAEDAAYPAAPDIGWLRIAEYLLEK